MTNTPPPLDAGIPTDQPDDISLAEILADIEDEQAQFDELDNVIPFDYFL